MRHRAIASNHKFNKLDQFQKFVDQASQVVGVASSVYSLGKSVAPYLRPVVMAAAAGL